MVCCGFSGFFWKVYFHTVDSAKLFFILSCLCFWFEYPCEDCTLSVGSFLNLIVGSIELLAYSLKLHQHGFFSMVWRHITWLWISIGSLFYVAVDMPCSIWRWEKHKRGVLNCVSFFFVFSSWSHCSEADRTQLLKWCSETKCSG